MIDDMGVGRKCKKEIINHKGGQSIIKGHICVHSLDYLFQ